MKTAVEEFLKNSGVSMETITAFKAETLPEGFLVEDAVNEFVAKRRELTLADSEVIKDMKSKINSELYPAIMKPLIKQLKNQSGVTDEEIAALLEDGEKFPSIKKLLPLALSKGKAESAKDKDELNAQLHELRAANDGLITSHAEKMQEMQGQYAMEKKNDKIGQAFNKAVSGLELVLPTDVASLTIKTLVDRKFKLDLSESGDIIVLNQDNTKAQDGKNFLSVNDVIKNIAKESKMLKVSNGGEGGEGDKGGGEGNRKPDVKLSGEALRMMEAIEARVKK
jgi:hypothetical protein